MLVPSIQPTPALNKSWHWYDMVRARHIDWVSINPKLDAGSRIGLLLYSQWTEPPRSRMPRQPQEPMRF
jgi:hypothetical protein